MAHGYVIVRTDTDQMLESYDPDYRPPEEIRRERDYPDHMTGIAEWTEDETDAMVFPSFRAAWECWKTQSTVVPERPDGQPNRPLTAYTVEIRKTHGNSVV